MLLRERTRPDHDRVDSAFAQFDLADPADYRAFLLAQASAFLSIEAALTAAGAEDVLPDWPKRRRAGLVLADLADLGLSAPPGLPAPRISSNAAVLGALYVIEGSRLGGAMLARRVSAHLPRRFLSDSDSSRWRSLVAVIDKELPGAASQAEALAAARAVFALFAAAAHAQAGVCVP
ncbi:MAG: biliverdin-producing heme oxygenase [Novosphingobium sp.]